MFGIYRVLLAVIIILHHFGNYSIGGGAVFGFYCLSGFLMTLLMNKQYRGRPSDYFLNRALRVYPTYWVALALSALVISQGARPELVSPYMGMPQSAVDALWQFAFVNYWSTPNTLIVTGWAVTNEVFWYGLIGIGISSSLMKTVIWLTMSIVLVAGIRIFASPASDLHYFSVVSASLPFAFGATLYHLREYIRIPPLPLVAVSLACYAACAAFTAAYGVRPYISDMSLIGSGGIVVGLYRLADQVGGVWRRADHFIGTLSYPMYLTHFTVGLLVLSWIPVDRGFLLGTIVLAFTVLLSIALVTVVDVPIERLRASVRANKAPGVPRVDAPALSVPAIPEPSLSNQRVTTC